VPHGEKFRGLKAKNLRTKPEIPRLARHPETKDLKNSTGSSLDGSVISASFLISAPF